MHSNIWTFASITLMLPFGIPLVVILVDQWRVPKRVVKNCVIAVLLLILVFGALVGHKLGYSHDARVIVGSVPMILAWLLFFCFSFLRDGRIFFTTATAGLLMSFVTATCSMFLKIGTPQCTVVLCFSWLLLLLISAKWLRAPYLRMLHFAESGWTLLSVIPMSLLVALNTGYLYPLFSSADDSGALTAVILCAATPLIYITIYRFLHALQAQYVFRQNEMVLLAQIRSLEQLTERMELAARQNRIFRHDLRHFLQLLSSSLQSGQPEQSMLIAKSMESELGELRDSGLMHGYTGQTLIDAVLSSYAERAEQAGISFSVQLTLPPLQHIQMTELAVVFSNALENAFFACRALPAGKKKTIKVFDSGAGLPFLIVFENTIEKPVEMDAYSGLPVASREGHGYGAQSIAIFADKYQLQLNYSQRPGVFSLRLLFP